MLAFKSSLVSIINFSVTIFLLSNFCEAVLVNQSLFEGLGIENAKFPSCKLTNKDGVAFRECQRQLEVDLMKDRFGTYTQIKRCCSFKFYRNCVVDTARKHCLFESDQEGLVHFLTGLFEIRLGMKSTNEIGPAFAEYCREHFDSKTSSIDCLEPMVLYSAIGFLILALPIVLLLVYFLSRIMKLRKVKIIEPKGNNDVEKAPVEGLKKP